MKSGVYQILNMMTGSSYVGSAVNIAQRWKSHKSSLRNHKKSPPKLQQAWDKYGEGAFQFRVLLYCSKESTLMYEQLVINALEPKYNTRPVAESNLGVKWSAETNAKKVQYGDTYTYGGFTGPLCDMAKHFGLEYNTLRFRLLRGWSLEDAVTKPCMSHSERGQKGGGKADHSGSLKAKAERAGLPYYAVRARVQRGWSEEKALSTPIVSAQERGKRGSEKRWG